MADQSDLNPAIRPATLEDVAKIVEFNIGIALETEDLVLDPATLTAGCSAILKDPTKGRYFVAEVDGQVVGQTMVTYEWSDWRNGNVFWIQSVYIAKDYRRRGIFKALYSYVKGEAQASGAIGLRLYAFHSNDKAHTTYKSLGMETHNIVFEDFF
jgi:GNAT superfamily N-acetyltransferase